MAHDIMDLFSSVAVNVGSWFTNVMEATGMDDVYLAYVFIFLCVSILIMPVVGGRIPFGPMNSSLGSDTARRK